MFRRSHLRKCLLFSLMLIILAQCGSLRNLEVVPDTHEVEQHQDVLAKITSDHQVSIYQKDQTDWVLTQEIETGAEILGVFLTEEFLVIEEEGYYLSLYEISKTVESLERKYEWMGRVQLNREEKVEGVEVKQNSLAVRFGQITDLYDFSSKTWTNERNERIMQEGLTFDPFVHISQEGQEVRGMKLIGDQLLYSGHTSSSMKLAKYDGAVFQQVFTSPNINYGADVEFDPTRKWLFEAYLSQVRMFVDSGSGYQFHQAIQTYISYTQFMDLHQSYFLISDYHHLLLYDWDGVQFNLENNFTINQDHDFYGVKICNDNTIIATIHYPINGVKRSALRVYNPYNNYQLILETFVSETDIPYTLVATDDCQTVILSPIFTPNPGRLYHFGKNQIGTFVMLNTWQQPRSSYTRKSCMHPDGDFFILSRQGGSDVWLRNSESGYDFYSTVGSTSQAYYSCAINRELIVLADLSSNVEFSVYNPSQDTDPDTNPDTNPDTDPDTNPDTGFYDPPEYGKKISVSVSMLSSVYSSQRKINVAFAGDYLVVSDPYGGSSVYTQNDISTMLLHQELPDGKFLTSLDYHDSFQLLVQGSYDRTAYVYKNSGSEFSPVQNISTGSQILAVDLDTNGRLLLGHINGDISEHSWDSFMFHSEKNFPTPGGRILGVKSCPNKQIVALKEKEGLFHLVLMGARGDEKHSIQLDELVGVKFAVAEDCRRVFISTTMQMQVQVFVMAEGRYSLFRTIQEGFPLYDIAINPQTDMFVVNRHTDHSSAVYTYNSCTEDYELQQVISGNSDHYSVQMSDDQILLGGIDGQAILYYYTYVLNEECSSGNFGEKQLTGVTPIATTSTATRPITNLAISSNLVIASSLYSMVFLMQLAGDEVVSVSPFYDIKFASSVSIVSELKTFAVGSFNKSVLVYMDSGFDYGYQLSQTIQTSSQVTCIDLCKENKLLVGMMNGDLAEYSSDGQLFQSPVITVNPNEEVFAVKLCPGGTKVAIMEAAGIFSLKIFPSDGSGSVSFLEELSEEFIEPYLSASQNCQIIAVSGVSMQKVQVFRKTTGYSLFNSIEIGSPLSKVSVEEEGDILVVPSVVQPESYVYQYRHCTGIYSLISTLNSGTYDESTAINNQYILQGNSDGSIQISQYSYIYNSTCEPFANISPTVRQKSSETSNSEDSENYKKMLAADSRSQDYSSSGTAMSPGIIFLIGLGSVIVFAIIVTLSIFLFLSLVRWMWKKEPQNEENREKATVESAKQIQSHQTF